MSDPEQPLREEIRARLLGDFDVFEAWTGVHKHSGEAVFYDLVLFPRQHLIELGFDQGYIVVELKLFNETDKTKHDTKAKDLLWQCVAYSYSKIAPPKQVPQRPLFVLYYIGGSGIDERYMEKINYLHHFVQRGGVGSLSFDRKGGWVMRFGGSYYFRERFGRGPCNVGTKRMTGSSR